MRIKYHNISNKGMKMSGKKCKKSDSSEPSIHRLSRHLNDLQADGFPVRLSRRLNDLNPDGTPISRRTQANVSPTKRSSAKRSIAVSIEKYAREQSKSKKKRAKISSCFFVTFRVYFSE